jgi:hypothetical protein
MVDATGVEIGVRDWPETMLDGLMLEYEDEAGMVEF